MRRLDIKTLLSFSVLLLSATGAHAEDVLLKGKVINAEGQGISGVKIILKDEDHDNEMSCKSDAKGNFEIEHEQCSTLSVAVKPSPRSGYTAAHYSHVAGDMHKTFIVKLQKGYNVSGRILAEGQGIKGLEVKAISQDDGKSRSTIHGGGITHSKGNGEYSFLLTPGKKIIQIKNDLYSNLSPLYQHEFTITGDTRLPDMTLPLLKEAN